ncbi:MAG: protoporphyrinogen oxidase [Mediterranea sp.]|jgi:oxygen-dependent protoporphyrinogen oxidase|nr:protoporphyrinogen oxidase [Mediterranea sp.]
MKNHNIVIVGAGLTGLTAAYRLKERDVVVLEQQPRIGGQIETHRADGFVFESGPNTGVVSYPEVAELFAELAPKCELEVARAAAECRLIWKGNRFRALPSGLASAVFTPLFTLPDKFRILGEPWRAKGTDPNESVGALARRRLGRSFVDYAVDPFLSGVYAGNPDTLITRYALPKLYNLEQNYGSFVRGAMAKAKEPKSERDRLATKKVFSARGGLDRLTEAMGDAIGRNRIFTGAANVRIEPLATTQPATSDAPRWKITYIYNGEEQQLTCRTVITTTGAYTLPSLLPFVPAEQMTNISNLRYAPVMQVSVGLRNAGNRLYSAFGGLVPSCEQKPVLGILFPSACFTERAPEGGALFSYFIGGIKHAELLRKSDDEIKALVTDTLHTMLKYPAGTKADTIHIFRHEHAIPQYELSSGKRFDTVETLQQQYPGLILAGNLHGGIGMADRIRQACQLKVED